MVGTISDWIIEMEKAGLNESAKSFHSEKFEDYERLKQSGLPTFNDLIVPFGKFQKGNKDLEEFLTKYEGFVIRAIPNTRELPRRYKIGVHDFEDCQRFLDQHVQVEYQDRYSIFLTEHEPTDWAGIIISRPHDVLLEVAQSGLDELSHGQVIPVGGHFAQHGQNHFKSMRYNTENVQERELMWRALQYLRRDLPTDSDLFSNVDFMKGYFEFVKTQRTDRIKFLDFKVNESYLK
ncbi:hypothetical protein ACFLTH_13620 [Bacteroidota bacterium]